MNNKLLQKLGIVEDQTSIAYNSEPAKTKAPAKKARKPKHLKKFGHGGTSLQHGSLSHHIGWLEALADDEEENCGNCDLDTPAGKRLEKVYDAIQLLNEAADMATEDQE